MGEVPLYYATKRRAVAEFVRGMFGMTPAPPRRRVGTCHHVVPLHVAWSRFQGYRGYSRLRTHTARGMVLCS